MQLKPRKAGSFSRRGSRWAGIKAHIERKGTFEMAGLEIHGQATDPDVDATYDLFKTLEIEFENVSSEFPPPPFFSLLLLSGCADCGWGSRSRHVYPQVGRGHEGEEGAADQVESDKGGDGE